jgi:hypothetical protein
MSAMVSRSQAMKSLSARRRSSTFSPFSAVARLLAATSGTWVSMAAMAGWLWRTIIISGVATIISVRRIHISMTADSQGSPPNRLGSG